MSWWTYVLGVVDVDVPGRTQAECKYIVDTVLDHLPLVTGSEGCMTAHVVQKAGYNSSSSHDEFGERTNNLVDYYGDKTRRHGFRRWQSHYLVVIEGDLRDRGFNQTKHELIKWLCRLAKRLMVTNVQISITGDGGCQLVISDAKPYYEMYELGEDKCWTDYLMWQGEN